MVDGRDPLVGTDLGSYHLLARIGHGATGVVYRATRAGHTVPLALKVLHKELGSISRLEGRYEREARVLARLSHPNIVDILDFGSTDGRTYIAMELLEGHTLEDSLVKAPVDPRYALEIYESVLEALAQAHAHGIVHRDLKPANVFLHDDGRIMLLDFGLSKILSLEEADEDEVTLTRKGRIVGSPGYMAPEQITGAFIDVRADVYALGIMLFELLADRRPFMYERRSELLRAHLLEPVPEISDLREEIEVAPELEAVVRKALDKDASKRFPSAAEMLEALRALPADCVAVDPSSKPAKPRPRRSKATSTVVTFEEHMKVTDSGSHSSSHVTPEPLPGPAPTGLGRLSTGGIVVMGLVLMVLAAIGGWLLRGLL